MPYTDLDPAAAQVQLQRADRPMLLDVRSAPEHASHRIDGCQLIPVQELSSRLEEIPDSTAGYVVVCEHGVRSVAACNILAEAGFGPLFNVRGGMARWIAEGFDYRTGGG